MNDVLKKKTEYYRHLKIIRTLGKIREIGATGVLVEGLAKEAAIGDIVEFSNRTRGEIVRLHKDLATVMIEGSLDGMRLGDWVELQGPREIFPCEGWIGQILTPDGQKFDGTACAQGSVAAEIEAKPPRATERRSLGPRLRTGLAVFDTLLPIVRGQRIGLFAGSGVGKSRLLADLARGIDADVVVIGLIGERGREVRDFVHETLGPEGMKKSVVIAATSDQAALTRLRAAYTMMSAAEYFRDQGKHVLVLADSITRLAEAYREVAALAGEMPSIEGFPASLTQQIMGLCERAGPGANGQGDITAVMSVLVAGSNMEGPIADILRGVLDGHVVLDRQIAERGRFPAIDILRSVSRSLPMAASAEENAQIIQVRKLLGAYDRVEMMLQAGLYVTGSDALADEAILRWPSLDDFAAQTSENVEMSFELLRAALGNGNAHTSLHPAEGSAQ